MKIWFILCQSDVSITQTETPTHTHTQTVCAYLYSSFLKSFIRCLHGENPESAWWTAKIIIIIFYYLFMYGLSEWIGNDSRVCRMRSQRFYYIIISFGGVYVSRCNHILCTIKIARQINRSAFTTHVNTELTEPASKMHPRRLIVIVKINETKWWDFAFMIIYLSKKKNVISLAPCSYIKWPTLLKHKSPSFCIRCRIDGADLIFTDMKNSTN